MESTKTSRGFLVAILVVAVVGLTALDVYQDRVIAQQRYELNWLKTHSVINLDAIAADIRAAKAAQNPAKNDAPKPPAADVAVVPQSSKPAAPAPAAKP